MSDSHLISWASGQILAVALAAAAVASFATFAVGWYFNQREDARQRALLCRAAQADRQVLRDLVQLVPPGKFRTSAEPIVNRRIPCDEVEGARITGWSWNDGA